MCRVMYGCFFINSETSSKLRTGMHDNCRQREEEKWTTVMWQKHNLWKIAFWKCFAKVFWKWCSFKENEAAIYRWLWKKSYHQLQFVAVSYGVTLIFLCRNGTISWFNWTESRLVLKIAFVEVHGYGFQIIIQPVLVGIPERAVLFVTFCGKLHVRNSNVLNLSKLSS